MSDHILKVELGEYTNYRLICNLDDTAPCHQLCSTHPEGGCDNLDDERECVMDAYERGCVVAEWVNDGGIESVGFEHTLELPVDYRFEDESPSIYVEENAPNSHIGTLEGKLSDLQAKYDAALAVIEEARGWANEEVKIHRDVLNSLAGTEFERDDIPKCVAEGLLAILSKVNPKEQP